VINARAWWCSLRGVDEGAKPEWQGDLHQHLAALDPFYSAVSMSASILASRASAIFVAPGLLYADKRLAIRS
jgi:hypothetical protein